MRIERLHVHAFGRLRELDTGPQPLPSLVVVKGPNEAGKSTLFHFLTSMLYGFYPASRDGNPYAPWDGGDPAGEILLRLDGGACVQVERRLLSQPTGRMEHDGTAHDLRNRTVPWAEHVPRAVFRQVFAVTLEEMAGLDEETWARVQDRILGSMGATDLRPARHVVAELEQEAGEIWRPTRRGNQRARDLVKQIRELRGSRRDALERDRRLRDLVSERDRVRVDLQDAREARQSALLAVERVQALIPIRTQLLRIAALRGDAGPEDELDGLPSDPASELTARTQRVKALRSRLDELGAERAEPQAAVEALGATDRLLLERSEAVTAFLARNATLQAYRDRVATLEQELRDLGRRIESAAAQILTEPLTPALGEALSRVPATELRERIRVLQAAREEKLRLQAEQLRAVPAAAPARLSLPAAAAVTLAGAVVAGLGLARGDVLVAGMGAALVVLGAALGFAWFRSRPAPPPAVHTAGTAGPDPEERARTSVAALLDGLPVLPSLAADPSEALTSGIVRVQELLRDVRERRGTLDETRARLHEADTSAGALAKALGRDEKLDALALGHLLERELRQAERAAERADASRRELRRLDREEERVRAELTEAEATLDGLTERLSRAGDGTLDQGVRAVRERILARDKADQLQDELERAHPDLEEIRDRIRAAEEHGESWTRDDDDLARRKAAAEELTQRVEELATRAEVLDRDIAHLRTAATVDGIDGEIAALEEEEQKLRTERDRRWVLAQLLRRADRRFREEHQPDVLRRAGEHLRVLTDGRYDRLVVDETTGNGAFQLSGAGLSEPVALEPPISTGTLEQAYLALRLAMVDHLDQGLERLPLFVDEVFVNWDTHRSRHGMDLLAHLQRRRQVFVFTCHDAVAGALAQKGALVLDLGTHG